MQRHSKHAQSATPTESSTAASTEGYLIKEQDVAPRLGVKVATLRRWRWLRVGVPWVKVGAAVRYRAADIDAFIDAGRVDPSREADRANQEAGR